MSSSTNGSGGLAGLAGPAHPGALAAAHDRLHGGDQTARAGPPGLLPVGAHDPVDGQSVGGDDQVELLLAARHRKSTPRCRFEWQPYVAGRPDGIPRRGRGSVPAGMPPCAGLPLAVALPAVYRLSMRISDVVRRKGGQVVTIRSDETVERLLDLLAEHRIGALVVSDDGESVTGIVSERDVVRHLHSDGAAVLLAPVGSIMTADVQTCGPRRPDRGAGPHDDRRCASATCPSWSTASCTRSSASATSSSTGSTSCSPSVTNLLGTSSSNLTRFPRGPSRTVGG